MILLELKKFFQERADASVFDVAKHYQIQASAAQGMIDFWLQRGCLAVCNQQCQSSGGDCNNCFSGVSQAKTRYQWSAE
jgi:hypothetical protein